VEDIEIPGGWRERLDTLATRRHALAAAAVVGTVSLLLLVTAGRQAPARIAPPATSETPGAPDSSVGTLFVHVAGAVRDPGLYEVVDGARVADAIAAAGGALKRADLDLLNLAQPVTDGMKVDVPRHGGSPAATDVAPGTQASDETVSVNSADQTALETIPGIGPVRAAAILAYRHEHGGFTGLEELLEVSGIGPATYEALLPYVTL
jgi:competence protein ComEA